MELRRYYTILRRRWLLIVVTIALGAGGAYLATPRTVRYRSSTTVYVGTRVFAPGATQGLSSDLALSGDREQGLFNLMATFQAMIPSLPIARDAVARTGVARSAGQVVGEISVKSKAPQLLSITVTDPDAATAQKLADGVASAFVSKVQQLEPTPSLGTLPTLPAYRFDTAFLPGRPLSSPLKKNLLLGALFGLLASCALAFLLEYVDLTIRSPEDAERHLGLPVLGVVPTMSSGLAPSPRLLHPVHLEAVPGALPGA